MATPDNKRKDAPPEETLWQRWRFAVRLLRLLWELSPGAMFVNAFVTLGLGLLPLLPLALLSRLVNVVLLVAQGKATYREALLWAVALALSMVLKSGGWQIARVVLDRAQERLRTEVQGRVIAKAQALPLSAFEQVEYYDCLQRVEHGLDHRLLSMIVFLFDTFHLLITELALAIYLAEAHWSLAVILIVGTVPFVLFRVQITREEYLLERKQTERQRRLHYLSRLMTHRAAASETRLFGLGDYLLAFWQRLYGELREERLSLVRHHFRYDVVCGSGQSLTFGIALVVVVALIVGGAVTAGQYAAFVGAVQEFEREMFHLFWKTAIVDRDLLYIRDLFFYLDLPEETNSAGAESTLPAGDAVPSEDRTPGIVFEGVHFAYPGAETPVLQGIDLHIRPGERISLVGENGAGKTTLAKLLLGLYSPTRGRILVDGIDLATLNPKDWRRRTAAIFQDFQQYHLTVRENIGFGDLERLEDTAAIERAARLSGADAVVATLPRGLETPLGTEFAEGSELSSGQWQKIAMARAYLRNAEVLVLDEPTAALDARAEVEVYCQFRDVSVGKTVLLISHRLGSARLADRILVLKAGVVAEQGTHAELMEQAGLYAQMLGIQAQWYA